MIATTDELTALLDRSGLGHRAGHVLTHARTGLRLRAAAPAHAAPGGTRLGGDPDLPADAAWPERAGAPLSFIGQVDLAGVPAALRGPLPAAGLVSFFYDAERQPWGFDPAEGHGGRIVYTPEPKDLVRVPSKAEMQFAPVPMELVPCLTLPASLRVAEAWPDADSDAYYDVLQELAGKGPHHQLLGHPNEVQNPMEIECELVTRGIYYGDASWLRLPELPEHRRAATAWRLLLQVDTDDDVSTMWGDCGMVYFWLREADLQTMAVERCWTILQCT